MSESSSSTNPTELSVNERLQASTNAVGSLLLRDTASLMATAGSEQKAITEGLMYTHGGSVSAPEIYRDFIDVQGGLPVWGEIGHAVPYSWIKSGFQNLGLVTRQHKLNDRGKQVVAFKLNERGETVGVAMAGLMLDLSERYEHVALVDLLGRATADEKTGSFSGEVRLAILFSLLTKNKPLSVTELAGSAFQAQQTGQAELARLRTAVDQLEKADVIHVERFKRDQEEVVYGAGSNEEPFQFKGQKNGKTAIPAITFRAAQRLTSGGLTATRTQIADEVKRALPAAELQARGEEKIDYAVRKALEHITTRRGLVNKSRFSNQERSEISLNAEYIDLVKELQAISNVLLYGDEVQLANLIAKGKSHMMEVLNDPARVNSLLQKGQVRSPNHNQASPRSNIRTIRNALTSGKHMSVEQLEALFESTGKPYGKASIRRLVSEHSDLLEEFGLTTWTNEHGQMIIGRQESLDSIVQS